MIEGLFALVVAAAEPRAALAADRVDFVDENDRRTLLFRSLKQVANACRTDADEHFHEVRARHGNERHASLAGNRARYQRLSGTGRTYEQDSLRNPSANLSELARLLQKVDDLFDFFFHRLVTGNVGEGCLRLFGRVHLGATPPDVHDRAHALLGAAAHEEKQANDQQDRKCETQQR